MPTTTRRVIANGSDFMCFVSTTVATVETLRPIANQKKAELAYEPSRREISNSVAGPWTDYASGNKAWGASVDVDFSDLSTANANANEVDWNELDDLQLADEKFDVVFAFVTPRTDYTVEPEIDETKPIWKGSVMVKMPVGGEHGANMSGSLELTGCGQLTKVNPT